MYIAMFLVSSVLIIATIVIHAVMLDRIIAFLERPSLERFMKHYVPPVFHKVLVLTLGVMGTFASHLFQIVLWACFYLSLDAIGDIEEALYFSASAFTTVGFGDLVLDKDWRLLSTFQAAVGFLMFSWSAAFIFEIMYRLYPRNGRQQLR